METIRVTHFGLGAFGAEVIRDLAGRGGFKLLAALDVDPTASQVINALSAIARARAGFVTMKEIPPLTCLANRGVET